VDALFLRGLRRGALVSGPPSGDFSPEIRRVIHRQECIERVRLAGADPGVISRGS